MTTTMQLIAKQTVGADGAASVTFSNIPQTYTDLKVVMSARGSASGTRQNVLIQLNGSGSNFTWLGLYGYNTSVGSNTTSNNFAGNVPMASNTANTFGTQEIYIPNYTSSTAAKSLSIDYAVENNGTDNFLGFDADLWNPGTQAPVTSITLSINSSGNFVEYSTFYLYGISNSTTTQATTVPYASGGDVITTDGSYWYHAFKYSGSFTPLKNLTADILVVAGGGGGGDTSLGNNGGGGAGGLVALSSQSLISSTNYTCTIGSGGAINTQGINSQFGSLTAAVGGGRGGYCGNPNQNGGTGGSGGGGAADNDRGVRGLGGAATSGQGNAGGEAYMSPSFVSGGGGGAGAVGGNGSSSIGGAGGNGSNSYSSWASATSTGDSGYYAGGGGGSGSDAYPAGAGGSGGGGRGASYGASSSALAGTANTGGGGGGGTYRQGTYAGKAGGSGIIIVRYAV